MKQLKRNERTPEQGAVPEHIYCCGTTCDSLKLAQEHDDLVTKVKIADKLVADLLNQIEVLRVTNKALGTQQALYYKWYLKECEHSEKLTVELRAYRDKPA